MISAPYVKTTILGMLSTRPEFAGVSLLYGFPMSDADLSGSDPEVRAVVLWDDPVGLLVVDEMCGPTVQEYREAYDIDIVIQVVGRDSGVDMADVEARKATLLWGLVQAVQDARLGFVASDDSRFDQVVVVLEAVEGSSGPLETQGTNLSASLSRVTLQVEAKITRE